MTNGIARASVIRFVGQFDGRIAQADASVVLALDVRSGHAGAASAGREEATVIAVAVLEQHLTIGTLPTIVVAIAAAVVGDEDACLGTSVRPRCQWRGLCDSALHILGVVTVALFGVEVEGAWAGVSDHFALPAHLVAIAIELVLDEDAIGQNVAIAVGIHFGHARKITYAGLSARIVVQSGVADATLTHAVCTIVIAIARVRIGGEAIRLWRAWIAGDALDISGRHAILTLSIIEKTAVAGAAHGLAIHALYPGIAGARIIHLRAIDDQSANDFRIKCG